MSLEYKLQERGLTKKELTSILMDISKSEKGTIDLEYVRKNIDNYGESYMETQIVDTVIECLQKFNDYKLGVHVKEVHDIQEDDTNPLMPKIREEVLRRNPNAESYIFYAIKPENAFYEMLENADVVERQIYTSILDYKITEGAQKEKAARFDGKAELIIPGFDEKINHNFHPLIFNIVIGDVPLIPSGTGVIYPAA